MQQMCEKRRKIADIFHISICYFTGIVLLLPNRFRSCQTQKFVRRQSQGNPHFLTCPIYENTTVCLLWTDTKHSDGAMPLLKEHNLKEFLRRFKQFHILTQRFCKIHFNSILPFELSPIWLHLLSLNSKVYGFLPMRLMSASSIHRDINTLNLLGYCYNFRKNKILCPKSI
jgi:hypothetical protein